MDAKTFLGSICIHRHYRRYYSCIDCNYLYTKEKSSTKLLTITNKNLTKMEQTTSTSPNLFKHAAKSGAILGGIGVAITAILYVVDIALLANWKIGIFLLLVFLGLVIYM